MRTYQKPLGQEVGNDQLDAMEESINSHMEKMFQQVAKRRLLDFGVGRTTMKANSQDTRLDAQRRDCDASAMFHAGRALEIGLHLVYARGANRIMGREYPGVSEAEMKEDRGRGHGLRLVYGRIVDDLVGRDVRGALEFCYQRALHRGVVDLVVDDELLASFTLAEDTPFREAVIGGMADGVEYTNDHSDWKGALFGEVPRSDFADMPHGTFEEFLAKADASHYESDLPGKGRRDMRWTDYFWRDHEYGRPYTVVGEVFFGRLVKEIVTLSYQRWVWDEGFAERWLQRHQYVAVRLMKVLANQNLEPGTTFADPVSVEKALERHRALCKNPEHGGATDNPDFDYGRLYHRKWKYVTKNNREDGD